MGTLCQLFCHFTFPFALPMKLFVGLALLAPSLAIRKVADRHAVATTNCEALADVEIDGKNFGKTLELVCRFWPADMGEFPVNDIGRAKELLDKVMDAGGVWDQIKEIRKDREDRGFCWRNNTLRDASTNKCPLGYQLSGLTGPFSNSCTTGCMWSSHPTSCGFGCSRDQEECSRSIMQQSFTVAQGVSTVYSFVSGDHRIRKAVAAITNLAEFMFEAMPPIVAAIKGALDIIGNAKEHGAYVAVILFQYLQETAPDVREPAEAIRDAIQYFGDIIARLAEEQYETGTISPQTLIRSILDHGEEMLEFAVRATKVFTHPTCSITANVAFTLEEVGDDRLLGPWVQRGEINGHPRYSLVGDRSTNLEWSNANGLTRWVMFTDGASGVIGRRILYQSYVRSMDYPMSGWNTVQAQAPVPDFVPVQERVE